MAVYKIIDDFQANSMRVLVLDRDYEPTKHILTIDGEVHPYTINSVRNWILIKSYQSFKGKTAVFA